MMEERCCRKCGEIINMTEWELYQIKTQIMKRAMKKKGEE